MQLSSRSLPHILVPPGGTEWSRGYYDVYLSLEQRSQPACSYHDCNWIYLSQADVRRSKTEESLMVVCIRATVVDFSPYFVLDFQINARKNEKL